MTPPPPIPPPAPGARIAVGMSGGIDSSVAAALLQEQGYEVIGLSLHMFKEGSRCCSIEDVNRARGVCLKLGLRHYVINVVDDFKEAIVRPFAAAYATGTTPNPCIFCNRDFKFGAMLRRARDIGCDLLATGHYVQVDRDERGFHLRRGVDRGKDQSYFLHRLSQEQLAHCRFPLGHLTKPEVRAYAAAHNLPVQGARETADLCFITAAGPAPLIEALHPEVRRAGEVTDAAGHALGRHAGIHHFTVGQRRGLGLAVGRPVYVKALDAPANRVVVGHRDELLSETCRVRELHWLSPDPPADGEPVTVRIRYRSEGVAGTLRRTDSNRAVVAFERPQFAVTPGQAAVFYRGDEVLGGGWIESED